MESVEVSVEKVDEGGIVRVRKLTRKLMIQAGDDCPKCGGTGLSVKNEYSSIGHKLEVTIEVCSCVRLCAVPVTVSA